MVLSSAEELRKTMLRPEVVLDLDRNKPSRCVGKTTNRSIDGSIHQMDLSSYTHIPDETILSMNVVVVELTKTHPTTFRLPALSRTRTACSDVRVRTSIIGVQRSNEVEIVYRHEQFVLLSHASPNIDRSRRYCRPGRPFPLCQVVRVRKRSHVSYIIDGCLAGRTGSLVAHGDLIAPWTDARA
jgi:hypothetical protein